MMHGPINLRKFYYVQGLVSITDGLEGTCETEKNRENSGLG